MKLLFAVALGGAAGTLLRLSVSMLLGEPEGFPWDTFLCNLTGSFLLGWIFAVSERLGVGKVWREALGTGVFGSFTTFSAFGQETLALVQQGLLFTAAIYALLSLLGGIACAAIAIRLGSGKPQRSVTH